MADIQSLIAALDVFTRTPDKASLESANTWLQDFQNSPEAWTTCNVLLRSPDIPPFAKLFAAQTFRAKVTYDLHQVAADQLLSLRDVLVNALQDYHAGPRNIIVQLSLAISGFALQVPVWKDAVQSMIDTFGTNPATVPALLQFLTLLPEEVTSNTRIPVTDDEYRERSSILLTGNAQRVLDLLTMYIQASGVTANIQKQVLNCLRSWLIAGEIIISALAKTPLFLFAFEALSSDDLFDEAVDVICETIHETQEIDDNADVIQLIVPRVIALKSQLMSRKDDAEKIKGFARIFTEAGETYRLLILLHTETFFPIVEAIGECSAYPDLDVVPITFPFWMRLAQSIGKKPSASPLFLEAYKSLMSVIIRHLHFPSDTETLVGQEADDFRSFRHVMGDTLKDCCYVLGTDTCLLATYQMITVALSRDASSISWQEIEAPLFAMRSMGAELDLSDHNAVPKIMDLIPALPNHPRVRYAALLIISRYTEWINKHPEYIQFQLQYISSGFEDNDIEVCAAAGQALKYLCQDCKQHLMDFLPTLHTFLKTTGSKLLQDDKRQVYEAIAYVISAMPMESAALSLKTFSLDILSQVHALAARNTATKQEVDEVGHGLENLEVMLHVVQTFGDDLPAACQGTCEEAWLIFDSFLAKYGSDFNSTERAMRVMRHGISFFGVAVLPIAPSVLTRLSTLFNETGIPSTLWITGKLIGRFGNEEAPSLRTTFRDAYEKATGKVARLLQEKGPRDIPDVLEDYLQMLLQMVDIVPDIFFQSTAFPVAFKVAMAALTLVVTEIVFAALNLFRTVLTHDSLLPPSATTPPKYPIYASAIRSAMDKDGYDLTGQLLLGIVGDFPEESTSSVITIFRVLSAGWSSQLLSWVPMILQQLPTTAVPNQAKTQFLEEITRDINMGQFDKVKHAIVNLHRVSRKTRDRRRITALDR